MAVDLDGDAVVVADDLAGGVEEAPLEGVGSGVVVVTGQAQPECRSRCPPLPQHA